MISVLQAIGRIEAATPISVVILRGGEKMELAALAERIAPWLLEANAGR